MKIGTIIGDRCIGLGGLIPQIFGNIQWHTAQFSQFPKAVSKIKSVSFVIELNTMFNNYL